MKRMKLHFSTPRRQSNQTHIIGTMPCVKEIEYLHEFRTRLTTYLMDKDKI